MEHQEQEGQDGCLVQQVLGEQGSKRKCQSQEEVGTVPLAKGEEERKSGDKQTGRAGRRQKDEAAVGASCSPT